MSGTFPTSPVPEVATLGGLQAALVSRARSGKRQSRRKGSRIWIVSASWPVMTKDEWAPMFAFAMSQGGQFGSFTWVIPSIPGSGIAARGTWLGSPVVDGASQTGSTLNIKGLTATQTGIAKEGDVFKVSGSTKVYMVTADANSDGAGKAALSISGPLITSPADAEALTVASVPFTLAFSDDQQSLSLMIMAKGGITLNFVESW